MLSSTTSAIDLDIAEDFLGFQIPVDLRQFHEEVGPFQISSECMPLPAQLEILGLSGAVKLTENFIGLCSLTREPLRKDKSFASKPLVFGMIDQSYLVYECTEQTQTNNIQVWQHAHRLHERDATSGLDVCLSEAFTRALDSGIFMYSSFELKKVLGSGVFEQYTTLLKGQQLPSNE